MPQALRCANSSRLLRETLPRALLHRKSLVDEVFPTCVYTVAFYERNLERGQTVLHTNEKRYNLGFSTLLTKHGL